MRAKYAAMHEASGAAGGRPGEEGRKAVVEIPRHVAAVGQKNARPKPRSTRSSTYNTECIICRVMRQRNLVMPRRMLNRFPKVGLSVFCGSVQVFTVSYVARASSPEMPPCFHTDFVDSLIDH